MSRSVSTAGIALLLGACTTTPSDYAHDYSLNWDSQAAVLYVYSPDGDSEIPAFGGRLIELPGYLFSHGAVRLHPGEQTIGYSCPQPDGMVLTDVVPSVRFKFEAGHAYELRCKDGSPVISERTDGA